MTAPRAGRAHRLPAVSAALAGLLLAVTALAGCGSSDSGAGTRARLSVVASTNVWGDIARAVGGPDVAVTSLVSGPSQDPHSFEVSAGDLLAVSRASVVVENGGGYDDFMTRLVRSSRTRATVLDAVEVSGKRAPSGGELNEHVWFDLPTAAAMADAIATALGRERPDDAAVFTRRARAFDARVDRLVAEEATLRRRIGGATIGITEPVPLYMTAACGLVDVTPPAFSEAIEEGDDLSPRVLQQTLDLFGSGRVDALVYNEQTSGAATERVRAAARAAGVPVVPVTETLPPGLDYVSWMQQNLRRLAAAVGRP